MNYSIHDHDSELTIGYCSEIVGLSGKIYEDEDHLYHKIQCKQFVFCNEFKEYIVRKKQSMNRSVDVCILDNDKNPIGSYTFLIYDEIYYHKIGFPEDLLDIQFKGSLESFANHTEIEIWNKWRITPPVHINEWAILDVPGRRAWLKAVKNYNLTQQGCNRNNEKENFFLDGTYVTDYPSFFCAMGEAINGPRGYFGFDLPSLNDCLCGGFGTTGPFTLTWKNYGVAQKYLDKHSWRKQVNYRRRFINKLVYEPEFYLEERANRPLIEALVETLEYRGVKIVSG
ncbi:ribonuclease inhibitor [Paenibacillus elgii]|uniref:Ribonuclease inhibitor n=1 Tax=Paenibacillus elgii TaxID=189691 RepID=A0A165Q5T8_9BACL|nr:barstar family protein [Paenibacillus elgii]KZE73732.1 ribonuclease inhibitor [Paenibacillus elgii]